MIFKNHLINSGKNYRQHFIFGIKASALLSIASITSLIHAIAPNLFPFTSQKIVTSLLRESETTRRQHGSIKTDSLT
jgi:Family of unknown function (DUF6356)